LRPLYFFLCHAPFVFPLPTNIMVDSFFTNTERAYTEVVHTFLFPRALTQAFVDGNAGWVAELMTNIPAAVKPLMLAYGQAAIEDADVMVGFAHMAALRGRACVRAFVGHGGSMSTIAATEKNPILPWLMQNDLHLDAPYLEFLLEQGVDVAGRDASNRTALHWLCATSHERLPATAIGLAAVLLQRGLESYGYDSLGDTPLMLATRNAQWDLAKTLALHHCANCGTAAKLQCGHCGAIRYCSTGCGAAHWQSSHRLLCTATPHLVLPFSDAVTVADDPVQAHTVPLEEGGTSYEVRIALGLLRVKEAVLSAATPLEPATEQGTKETEQGTKATVQATE
jgi:hypothetical protein